MFQINNNDFQILIKYKRFLTHLDHALENVPRKDFYYKDLIRLKAYEVLEYIFMCSYDDKLEIKKYRGKIKSGISMIDFLLDRLFDNHYINDKQVSKLTILLTEINKMVNGWIGNMVNCES